MRSVLTPKNIISSGETIQCRNITGTLRYHVPNKLLSPKKLAHDVLLLFYPITYEN